MIALLHRLLGFTTNNAYNNAYFVLFDKVIYHKDCLNIFLENYTNVDGLTEHRVRVLLRPRWYRPWRKNIIVGTFADIETAKKCRDNLQYLHEAWENTV